MDVARPGRVLVVEDVPEFRHVVAALLAKDGLEVIQAPDGETGLHLMETDPADVVVLDVELPGIDGFEVCRRIRAFSDVHVLMLTGRDDDVDKVVGLTVGADDYVVKPISPRELVARVRAMLRRATLHAAAPARTSVRRIGELELDAAGHEVRMGGEPIELTQTEFALLDVLSSEPAVVFSRAQLLERVWGPNWYGDDHVVDVHLSKLRRKLDPAGTGRQVVRTVRGVGFRMAA